MFARLDRIASRAIDRVNGVAFWVLPMKRAPNGRPVTDPERGQIEGQGVFDEAPDDVPLELGNRDRRGNDFRYQVNAARYELSVDVSRYPDAQQIRQGDRLSLDDARVFEVTSVAPDGLSRLVLSLVRA